jgi:hypothetical protein
MQPRLKNINPVISAVISSLRRDIRYEFGPLSRVANGLLGPFRSGLPAVKKGGSPMA